MPSLDIQELPSSIVSLERDGKLHHSDASGSLELLTDGEDLGAQLEDHASGPEGTEDLTEGLMASMDHKRSSEGFEDCKKSSKLNHQATGDSATPKAAVKYGHAEATGIEVAIRKRETDPKCSNEEWEHSKEKDRGLDAFREPEETKDEERQVAEHANLDHGWAWLALIGSFIVGMMTGVLIHGFGILFSGFLTDLGTSSTVSTAIFNTGGFIFCWAYVPAGMLSERFGTRWLGVCSGLLVFVGLATSAFAPSAPFLFFSFSFLTYFGIGNLHFISCGIIPHYFKRMIGRANAVMWSGNCVGAMVGPPVVTFLQIQYGFRNATLIVAAFSLNLCVAGALFRAVQRPSDVTKAAKRTDKKAKDNGTKDRKNNYYSAKDREAEEGEDKEARESKNKTVVTEKGEDSAVAAYEDKIVATDTYTRHELSKDRTLPTDMDTRHELSKDRTLPTDTDTRHELSKDRTLPTDTDTCHELSKNRTLHTDTDTRHELSKNRTLHTDTDTRHELSGDKITPTDMNTRHKLSNEGTLPTDDSRHELSKNKTTNADTAGPYHVARQIASSLIKYLKLFKSCPIFFLAICDSLIGTGFSNVSLLVPFILQDYGHTQEAAAWCLTIANVCNLVTRLLVASSSDIPWFNSLLCVVIFAAILSLTSVGLALLQDLTWFTVILAAWGCGVGACMSLHAILLLQYAGVKQFSASLVLHGLFNGVWAICSGILIGVFSDLTGSYTVSLIFIGGYIFLSVILYSLVPIAADYEKRKDQARKKDAELGG